MHIQDLKFNNIIKLYTNEGGMWQSGLLTENRKIMENFVWTKYLVFCRDYNAPNPFSEYTKGVLEVQRAWYFLNTLPTTINCQTCIMICIITCIMTWHAWDLPLNATRERAR